MENKENKKSFGAFICQRRKELNMTQKEFAQKLFVTDSAGRKPLQKSICGCYVTIRCFGIFFMA